MSQLPPLLPSQRRQAPSEASHAVGLIALVLGSIGLVLFFLPILGVPLSAIGLLVGLLGMATAWPRGASSLRWAAAGFAVCLVALTLDLLIAYAPLYLVPGSPVPPMWQALQRPYVAPPARPEPRSANL